MYLPIKLKDMLSESITLNSNKFLFQLNKYLIINNYSSLRAIKIIMKNIIFKFIIFSTLLPVLVFASTNQTEELKLIRGRLIDWAKTFRLRGDKPRKSVEEYLKLLNPNGSFKDKKTSIDIMTGRLLLMAQAFNSDPKWKNNVNLKTNLYNAIQYWLKHDPGNSGWTSGCFNEPASISAIGLCLINAIQNDKTNSPNLSKNLDSLVNGIVNWANAAWTVETNNECFIGANIAYRLNGMIARASLANSPKMFDDIKKIVASTFVLKKPEVSGRHTDEAWHQHCHSAGQNYWLGYGADWLYLTRKYCTFLKNTRWGLSNEQLNILANGIIDGWQWLVYRDEGVYSLRGRHGFKKTPNYTVIPLLREIKMLRNLAGEKNLTKNDELEKLKFRLLHNDEKSPSFDASKFFYTSDIYIHGKPHHYVAVKMISKRTTGPESGNGEGIKNYHFGEGSTIIFKTGKEYVNARVVWNCRAFPGTTIEQKNDTLPLVNWGFNTGSSNKFSGGLTDDGFGLCAFKLNRTCKYSKVTADKSYFFFDDGFVALGTEITKHPPFEGFDVWTTIDQPERKTDIVYSIGNGKREIIPLNQNKQIDFTNVTEGAWFLCNGNGYVILPDKSGVNVKLWAEVRTGDWHDVDKTYPRGDTQVVNIFQLSINHNKRPVDAQYAYVVLPDTSEKELSEFFKEPIFKILKNSAEIQAVKFLNTNITEIVFYKAGSIYINNSTTVSVDKPAIVMVCESKNKYKISVADPNQEQEKIILTINDKVKPDKDIIWDSKSENSVITFNLPTQLFSGKSVSKSLLKMKNEKAR